MYYINTRTVCVSVCVYPVKSCEWNVVSPHTFCQRKELLLPICTNCLMSSLLERKVVNTPFSFIWGFNVLRSKPFPPSSTYDVTCAPAFCSLLHGMSYHHAHFTWSESFASCTGQVRITNTLPLKHEETERSRRLARSAGWRACAIVVY